VRKQMKFSCLQHGPINYVFLNKNPKKRRRTNPLAVGTARIKSTSKGVSTEKGDVGRFGVSWIIHYDDYIYSITQALSRRHLAASYDN